MVLNERERKIAIAIGVLVALLVVSWGTKSYFDTRSEIATDIDSANADLKKAAELKKRQASVRKIWDQMLHPKDSNDELGHDPSEAQSRLENNIANWVEKSGFNKTGENQQSTGGAQSGRNTPEGKFQTIGLHISGTGPLSTFASLMWYIETSSMPIRVTEVQITPAMAGKEGQDDLQFQLTVSTLCRMYDDKNARLTADARGGAQ